MMKEWHFNVLFIVGVGAALVLLFGPDLGLNVGKNPTATTGVGLILGYVLSQKPKIVKSPPNEEKEQPKEEEGNGA